MISIIYHTKKYSYTFLSGTWLRIALSLNPVTASHKRISGGGSTLISILLNCNTEKVSRILLFVKGKVMFAPVFQLFMIYSSWRRDPERIRGDPWRCQKDYLVMSVRRHLQVGKTFSSTSRSTVGSRSTVVQSVTSHLFRISIWKFTSSFTPGRSRTSAPSAAIHAMILPPSKGISTSTPGKICTIAISVNIKQHNQATWRGTRKRTLVKSLTDAQCASIRAFKLVNWNTT